MEVSQHQLEALRNAVENRYGQTLNSPHDFMCLGERLQNEGAGSLSGVSGYFWLVSLVKFTNIV